MENKDFRVNWYKFEAESRIWYKLCNALEDCYNDALNDLDFATKYNNEKDKRIAETVISVIDDYMCAIDRMFTLEV